MKIFKLKSNFLINSIKKNRINKYFNIFLEKIKNFSRITNFKKRIFFRLNEFYEKKFKVTYLLFFLSLLFFYYLIYLSFPGILHNKSDQSYFTKLLKDQYELEFALTPEINYSILPKPHFQINDVIIFNKRNEFQKEIAEIKKLKIFLSHNNFFKKKKLKINSIEFFDTNFFINKNDISFVKNFLDKGFSKNPIIIKRANFFYQDLEKKTILFSKIKRINMNFNNKIDQNILISEGDIFNLPFNLTWKYDENKLEKITNLKFKKINLNITNSTKLKNNEITSKIQINSNRSRYIINYETKDNFINISSKNSFVGNDKLTFSGKLFLDPFNFKIKSSLDSINFSNILLNSVFFEEILSKDFFLNENFNGKIMIDIPKLKKNPLFDKVKLNANFIGQTLDLSKSELLNEKIANLILKKGSLYEDQNNLIFRGNLDFIINNIDKFNNKFVIPKKNRIDLKKISFEILVNLTNYDFKIIKIINEKYKDKEFQKIDDLIYEFNSGGLKISNWIEFKNFTNKIISFYSG